MKVYIVMCNGELFDVFKSKELASEYIWDWDNRAVWIDEGYDIDSLHYS